jgi:hypothetical protein
LVARQQRVEKLHIVPLSVPDASRFGVAWRDVQARFVDDPRGALWQADALVRELMQARGYPIGNDFDRCASDISVDHPHVVNHFRAAQAILDRDRQAPVDTETMRKAIVHYRALFDDLLQTEQEPATVYAQPMEARR